MIQVLIWWLLMQILGWLALPTAMRIFRWLPDRGYSFSKALGLLVVSYFLWIGASTGLLKNDLGGILAGVFLLAAVSGWLYYRNRQAAIPDIRQFLREKWKLVVTVEVLFALALVAWVILRAYAPYKIEPTGGEKFMEIAFQNAILRSQHFPPLDPWLSGFAISYYYYGYVMMAMLTRLSGAVAGVAFDLYDALLFALTLLGSFGVTYNLVAYSLQARHKDGQSPIRSGSALAAGVLGGVLVTVMGNLEGVLESLHARGIVRAGFWTWIDIPGLAETPVINSFYPGKIFLWWWKASRVLADKNLLGQNMLVQPIDEFPFFSFLLGDNHPHVLALPFVLLAIGLALNLLLRHLSEKSELRGDPAGVTVNDNLPAEPTGSENVDEQASSPPWWNPVASTLGNDWLLFIFSGLILGSLGFLNTWDLPIYLGLVVLAYGLGLVILKGHLDREVVARSVVLGFGLGILSIILYFFFYLSFSSQAAGILPYVFPPTRLPQYLVMFGTLIFLAVCYLLGYLSHQAGPGQHPWRLFFTWWLRILGLCIGLFLAIMLLIGLAYILLKPAQDSSLMATLQMVLGGMSLNEAYITSIKARLTDPWLLLTLTALLAMVFANLGGLLKGWYASKGSPSDDSTELKTQGGDIFAFLLVFTGLALTLIVEFVYLRDGFGVRMNTVFKFYYQAWVMLGIAGAYGTWWLLDHLERPLSRILFAAGAVLFIGLGLVYPLMAYPSRAGGFAGPANLDGSSSIAANNPDDWAAIQWLDANAEQGLPPGDVPVILEAPWFGSYNYDGRISVFTGFPTVLGWAGHEGQWRGSYDEQARREPDIASIYTSSDAQLTLDLLRKYGVNFVILGGPEMNYIQNVCNQAGSGCSPSTALRKFSQLLQPVFTQGQITIYKVP